MQSAPFKVNMKFFQRITKKVAEDERTAYFYHQ